MQRKALPNLLEPKREYTYEEAFNIYDNAAKEACEEENKKINEINKKRKEEADRKYSQLKKDTEASNAEKRKKRIIFILIISFVLSLFLSIWLGSFWVFIISLPIFYMILNSKIKNNETEVRYESPIMEEVISYTFLPSGTIQCSSCGTKTKIDTKDASSVCPNCRSEIFVISDMEDNVTVKSIARSS